MISSVLIAAIALAIFALVLTAALSPLETLSWWAGWTEQELGETPPLPDTDRSNNRQYIVYLSGIASISGRYLLPREKAFIRRLKKKFPDAVIISDVFPYSPKGLPLLAAPRLFDRLWRRVQKFQISERQTILSVLINLRNVFQVMVSADHRYGPIFNQGAASVIETALLDKGYARGAGAPIVIIGYSGGAQVAVGATPFLIERLRAPIEVISIGGVMASDPGLAFVRKLHHLAGDGDNIQRLGGVLFPERWPLLSYSYWNAAKREGRIKIHPMPNVIHAGVKGYFGRPPINGTPNSARTVEKIASLLPQA